MKNILRMITFAKRYWLWALLALAAMLLVSVLATLQAYLIKPLFDDLLLAGKQGVVDSSGLIAWLDNLYAGAISRLNQLGLTERPAAALLILIVMLGHNFFMFYNANTGSINVVYKRTDGNYGLIEPR